ncbi:MAG: cobalamin biosynthesis protein CbiD [Lachnospiraceae bacterium]|nr:cobalamin biosynthesis protein CbiD [Lachnospiraceae bacterium]
MRFGFTTGSAATAASKAAALMLFSGALKNEITIETPKGIPYTAEILDIKRTEGKVSCAVKKDGGDDPDITSGTLVYAEVSVSEDAAGVCIQIEGGIGVGKVTKPGLDQPVGEYAINSVPRKMIEKEIREVCDFYDFEGTVKVVISVPEGEKLAEKTFNPKLGIEGGISIIGTSGIVEPMSTKAILDTIRIELRQRRELGFDTVVVSPGNYGLDFMRDTYGYDLDKSVKCSNYIGLSIDMAKELGFKKLLYVGHIGKLIKVAGGIMNTHSKEADCRMEILSAIAIQKGIGADSVKEILNCVTCEEAVKHIRDEKIKAEIMSEAAKRICANLERRAGGEMKVECIIFSKELGELGKSEGAGELIKEII